MANDPTFFPPLNNSGTIYPNYTAGNTINVNLPHAVSAGDLIDAVQRSAPAPKELTDREWLDEQISEVCELAS